MSKPDRSTRKQAVSIARSSAAEYLTFVAAAGQGGVEAVFIDGTVWLTQRMMGQLYDVNVRTVSEHLKKTFADTELREDSVIRKFRITAADGKSYDTQHYNLAAIIAVGYKVNSERAVQFRKWATGVIEAFTLKGYTMDDERLKNGGSILSDQYFEEQLQRVREMYDDLPHPHQNTIKPPKPNLAARFLGHGRLGPVGHAHACYRHHGQIVGPVANGDALGRGGAPRGTGGLKGSFFHRAVYEFADQVSSENSVADL